MPRSMEISIRPDKSQALIEECRKIPGVFGLRVYHGVSLNPPGDVVSVGVTDQDLPKLMRVLDRMGLGREEGLSMVTNQPVAVVSPSHSRAVDRDSNMATWEEMELAMGRESNKSIVTIAIMFIAGIIATVGLATNALHLVIGAMVIAPGFQPLVRIGQGFLVRAVSWRYGLIDASLGYLALLAGAVTTSLLSRSFGAPVTGEKSSYLPPEVLVNYWTSLSPSGVLVSAVAGMAGAMLIATHRAVLTSGVMIALALIPSLVIAGMGLVQWELSLVKSGLLRWGIDVVLVIVSSLAVFAWKRWRVDRRTSAP